MQTPQKIAVVGSGLVGTGNNAVGVESVTGSYTFCKNVLSMTSVSPYHVFTFEPFRTKVVYLTCGVTGSYSLTVSYIFQVLV